MSTEKTQELVACSLDEATHIHSKVTGETYDLENWRFHEDSRDAIVIRQSTAYERGFIVYCGAFNMFGLTPMKQKPFIPTCIKRTVGKHDESLGALGTLTIHMLTLPNTFAGKEVWISDREPASFKED